MSLCIWEDEAVSDLLCAVCKRVAHKGRPGLRVMCPGPQSDAIKSDNATPPQMPGAARKLSNFAKALAAHVAAGSPKATKEQIDARFVICQRCPLLVRGVCGHEDCGCNIDSQARFRNKLAWADQACPDGKWTAIL